MLTPRPRPSRVRQPTIAALALVFLLFAAACGSDSDDDADETGTTTTAEDGSGEPTDPPDTTAPDATEAPAEPAASDEGGGIIVVTVADGTVYEFTDISACDTSATAPESLPLTNGYDLTGRTADGAFAFFAGRAGFDDDGAVFSGSIEGDFDDEGRNALMLYVIEGDGTDLVVDGANVSGTVAVRAVGPPNRPHGDETTITVEASC
ncbi:MAG: hypothetical protein AAGA99_21560 [Actinomycetota bacterium]